jgi:SAM-dependent methyltransferase
MRVIGTEPRDCESCGSTDLEPLWFHFYDARTRDGIFRFPINDVICRVCGFVFVSPVFIESDIGQYYKASYSAFAGAAPDYSVANRAGFLSEIASSRGIFVEIGSNRRSEFHSLLERSFSAVKLVELNDSVDSDFRSLSSLPDQFADVLAHYFVLEHIPRVPAFLHECHRVLRPGGTMVCEVPDISYYPRDPAALQLHEHTSHFSQDALRTIAGECGFEMLRADIALCSRPFGFVAEFRRREQTQVYLHPSEYEQNRGLVLAGLARMRAIGRAMAAQAEELEQYTRLGQPVICWAANDLLVRFALNHGLPTNVTVVDSNPEKNGFLDGVKVLTPGVAEDEIKAARAIFIFTCFHAQAILRQIEKSFGKTFETDSIHIVDHSITDSR